MSGKNCEWCTKEMPENAIMCPHCGKLRKDIYRDKILFYVSSISLVFPIILFLAGYRTRIPYSLILEGLPEYAQHWYVWGEGVRGWCYELSFANFISSASGFFIIILFVILLLSALHHYVNVSKKLGTWIWI